MATRNDTAVVLREEQLRALIYKVRGVEVMLDSDLARLYGIETRVFNQAVKRNLERFPESFRFQLAKAEHDSLRSQIVTLNAAKNMAIQVDADTGATVSTKSAQEPLAAEIANSAGGRGRHRKYLPYVFTEQGVAMLSAVLRSRAAIEISISIINAFVGMRRFLVAHEPLQRQTLCPTRHASSEAAIWRAGGTCRGNAGRGGGGPMTGHKLISKKRRTEFREFLVGWTLREIENEFAVKGAAVTRNTDHPAYSSGQ